MGEEVADLYLEQVGFTKGSTLKSGADLHHSGNKGFDAIAIDGDKVLLFEVKQAHPSIQLRPGGNVITGTQMSDEYIEQVIDFMKMPGNPAEVIANANIIETAFLSDQLEKHVLGMHKPANEILHIRIN